MSVDEEIGGYPVEWFVKVPSENFKCGICLDVLKNPHQCKNGHTFCYSCISLALAEHSECPTCKTVLTSGSLCISLSLRNVIDEMLVVKCCHDGGCKWTGTLEQSVKHFELCSMRSVPCPLYAHHVCTDKNCTGIIKRKNVHKHVCDGNKRDVANTMLIMAETIAYQTKEIELLHEFILSGETKIHTIDQSTFVGTLKDGKKDGFGFTKDTNGATYSGHIYKGQYDGFGVMRSNECVRAGMWENGYLNGHGMTRFPHNKTDTLQNCASVNTYIGDFKNDYKHGFGRLIRNNASFVGSFENGLLNDIMLECTFYNNKRSTTTASTFTSQDGTVYCGSIDEKWHFVEGKYTNINGVVYEGSFCDNANEFQLNGTGKITYVNSLVYNGAFRGGLKHGKGTLVGKNGLLYAAREWNNDKPVYPRSDFRRGSATIFDMLRSNGMIGCNSNDDADGALNLPATITYDADNNNVTAGVGRKRKNSL